jgi:hypothetical protein
MTSNCPGNKTSDVYISFVTTLYISEDYQEISQGDPSGNNS